MAEITTLFWDVGGVLLTNGWDRAARRRAAEQFHLDWEEFEDRHDLVVTDFEKGRLTLDEYLQRTVFYRSRSFSQDDFKALYLLNRSRCPRCWRWWSDWRIPGSI